MTQQLTLRSRVLHGVAAVGSVTVATVFATIGDGVDVPGAAGLRRVVIDWGHPAVWVLLAIAFALASGRGRWTSLSNGLAVTAGLFYVVFLIAVFVWP